jgi:ribosome assembly protein SQT1
MTSENLPNLDPADEEEVQFIHADDILTEIIDDGDHPMDEDEHDEPGDAQAEPHSSPDQERVILEDNSLQHFPDHHGSVFTVSTHPTEPIAASGGEDDLGYLWDITDGEILEKLTGHKDSVTSTAFSTDGEMIATGGMDGRVRVWKRVGKENWRVWEFVIELVGPDEVMVRSVYYFYRLRVSY